MLFLKHLLKGQNYVKSAYMTGVLPIVKYLNGSELYMFLEYNMATRIYFSKYFGFSDNEVDMLYQRCLVKTKIFQIIYEKWYDGYCMAAGDGCIIPAWIRTLLDNQLSNF